jgi:TRAP-type mannitol/chloroaromatic compound transport system permease large subunit
MGFLTPPFGLTAFVIKASVAKDDDYVTVEGVFRGGVPYLFMMAITVALVIFFPALATWLPSMN